MTGSFCTVLSVSQVVIPSLVLRQLGNLMMVVVFLGCPMQLLVDERHETKTAAT